jgi:hypothetical protein
MSWHKMTLKVIDVLALLGHRCLGTYQLVIRGEKTWVYLIIKLVLNYSASVARQ